MPYKYTAYDTRRQLISGTIDVANERTAKEVLQQSGYALLSLKFTRPKFSLRKQVPSFFGVKTADVISFSRMLATLISRGTNTVVAMEILRDQVTNATFKEIIQSIVDDVRRGVQLADAMSRHPEAFSALYCRTIKVSEQTGNLENVLIYVADHIEKQGVLVSKVARSLAYPLFVLLVGIGVISLLVLVTLPALSDLFLNLGGELPLPTKIMVVITDAASKYLLHILGFVVFLFALGVVVMSNEKLRFKLDIFILKVPLVGPVITLREMINFSRTVSTCLASSLSMPETLGLAAQTATNRYVTAKIEEAREEVLKGRELSGILPEFNVFPQPLIQMIKVGEMASTLKEDLATIAEMYDLDVDRKVNTMVSVLSPGIMLVLGAFVAFIAVSMIMPIYSFLGSIE
ncbi:MAG: type II secretion system F family protein [Chloroflexi bacterium]|nr:type II secretion system F family protein [Chloroflexota bacterium]